MSAVPAVKPASPPPPCCEHDHSDGVRAKVTLHAIRRYGDRILGLEETLEGLDDAEAVDAMVGMRLDVPAIREWLSFYGGVGKRHGAVGVCRDGVGLVLQGGRVVTVISKRGERRHRA
ncbi:hypothetical protein [Methylobacterium indicum]|uniref:Uncharacterized protein n=1 Tax=Methylobacterium indicum TaxID=1775910 RepID=A0A8H8WSV6_9HYPH|nr:hypothetical protein [Methylobacterium indicum]BCM83734.1 hypothetical protein mvi_21950 [Methylobacterium indicum]